MEYKINKDCYIVEVGDTIRFFDSLPYALEWTTRYMENNSVKYNYKKGDWIIASKLDKKERLLLENGALDQQEG